jgi:adenosine deaminase/adenosine deaminase CECR1
MAHVFILGAYQNWNGVDLAYEGKSLLTAIWQKIVLPSKLISDNEFILNVKSRHPFSLYKEFGVPIVISTDDAGILRTNMTEQYVLLAKRYKTV